MKVNRKVDAAHSYSHIYLPELDGASPRSWQLLVAVTISLSPATQMEIVLIFILYIFAGSFHFISFHFVLVLFSLIFARRHSVRCYSIKFISRQLCCACPIVRALFFFLHILWGVLSALFDVDMRASVLCQI